MKTELNYNLDLSSKAEWWLYFGEYKYFVDFTFRELEGGEISGISLPLAFCIRHTLELGYKTNLLELEKISGVTAKIKYKGKSAHKIDDLHREYGMQLDAIFRKYEIDKEIMKQFKMYMKTLQKFKYTIHRLDELSYAFRYPVKNDGVTPNFKRPVSDKTQTINFKEIKELYEESIFLLKYTTDVLAPEINK